MKKKIIFIALCVCISIFAQSDFEQLNLQIQCEQAAEMYNKIYAINSVEIENIRIQQDHLFEELHQAEQELTTANSTKAKKLNKRIESLTTEILKNEYQIKAFEEEIEKAQTRKDSLQLEFIKQQKSINEEVSHAGNINENDNVDLSGYVEVEDYDEEDSDEEENAYEENGYNAQDIADKKIAGEHYSTTSSPKKEEANDDPIGTALFALGVIVLFVVVVWIKRERCPYCGKKGTLKSLGDTRKYQYDEKGNVTRTGVLKRYKCNHCGHYVEKLKWG